MTYPIVEVEWIDSATQGGWHARDGDHEVAKCLTAGYLLAEYDDRYVTANSLDDEDGCAGTMVIPKVAVTKFTTVRW